MKFLKNIAAFLLLSAAIPAFAQMDVAYKLANGMVREKLNRESKDNIRILDNLKNTDIIVVDGTYDHIDQVLGSLKIPYVAISQDQLTQIKLDPQQTIFVNCASTFPADAARRITTFVAEGGQLITTDWALRSLVEIAFPGMIQYNGKPTEDEVVRVEAIGKQDSVVTGFMDEKADPVWWLEGSSYPIKILNKEKVKVLIRSRELKEKYGEEAVVVRFEFGKGTVYHMISHLYLQRTETRDSRQNLAASVYFKDKGGSAKIIEEAETTSVTYGEIQSANTSADFISRIIIRQRKRVEK
jgi:hypothetical protein